MNPVDLYDHDSTTTVSLEKGASENNKTKSTLLKYRRGLIVFVHVGLFALSLLMAFGLAHNFKGFSEWFSPLFLPILTAVLIIKLLVFWGFGLYHGWWRYVSLQDLFQITKASHLSTFLFVLAFFLTGYLFPQSDNYIPFERFPQSIFLLDWACTIALVCGIRVAVRMYHEEFRQLTSGRLIRVLVLGAGDVGEMALREIHRMSVEQYEVIGLLDDDPSKHGASILGYKVLGSTDRIKEICEKYQVDEVLIALSNTSPKEIRKIVEQCQGTNIRFRTLPPLKDLISGRLRVSSMREVDINDLLGREPAHLDTEAISSYIKDKVVVNFFG